MTSYVWRLEFVNPKEGTYEYVVPAAFRIVDLRCAVKRDPHPAVVIDRSHLDGPYAGIPVPTVNIGYKVLLRQMTSAGQAFNLVCEQTLNGILVLEVVYELPGVEMFQHNGLDTSVFDYPFKIQVGRKTEYSITGFIIVDTTMEVENLGGKGFHLAPNMEWVDAAFYYEHAAGKGEYDKERVKLGRADGGDKFGFSAWVEQQKTGGRGTYFKIFLKNYRVPTVLLDCSFRFRMGNQPA